MFTLVVAAFMGLIQFPFGAPLLLYVAPLFALSAVAALRYARVAAGQLPVALLVAYTLFGFVWLDRDAIYLYALTPSVNPQTVPLDSHRASIRVTKRDRGLPERHQHARATQPGALHLARPESRKLYFLDGQA